MERQTPTISSLPVAQLAEQRIGEMKKLRAQEATYYNELEAAVGREQRNESWAVETESKLQKSYAAESDVPSGALKRVMCRSSKCTLLLEPGHDQSPQAAIQQQLAIDHWIAWSQPCGYLMTTTALQSGKSPEAIRIFIDCSK
jgi:hypothetical protein